MAMIDGPRVQSLSGRTRQLVIFLHGYWSNGADLIGLANFLAPRLPDAAFVSPNAPTCLQPEPGAAYQWFGITRLEPEQVAAGTRAAAPALDSFIDQELERHGIQASDCALMGFSQGAMMALHCGLRRPDALGAIVGFSGLLAGPETLAAEIRSRPPVLLAHGAADDVVPASAVLEAASALAEVQAPAMWSITPAVGHTISKEAADLATAFVVDAFTGRLSGWKAGEQVPRGSPAY